MSNSFYTILGVDEKASKEEIKKAFRTLSMKWHPDKNPGNPEAVGKFQQISEAYETLGSDEKREQYDMMNNNPFSKMNMQNGNMDDMLNAMFGSMPFFNGGGPMHSFPGMPGGPMHSFPGMPGGPRIHIFHGGPMGFQQAMQKPSPIVKNVMVNIEQILTGTTIPIDIERWIVENGNKVFEKETLYVVIPQGIDDNEIIIVRDKGNFVNENCKGDVKIFVKITNNTEFKRSGLDLILEKEISLKEALCGFSFEIKYINGKTYTLNNSVGNIIQSEHQKIIQGLGLKRENHVGNLIVVLRVKFPEKLSEDQIEKLKQFL